LILVGGFWAVFWSVVCGILEKHLATLGSTSATKYSIMTLSIPPIHFTHAIRNRWKVTVEFDGFRMCQKRSKFDKIRIRTSSNP